MALQTIDTVNIPEITNPSISVPIDKFGNRYHTSTFDSNTDAHIQLYDLQAYSEGVWFFFHPFTCSSIYYNSFFKVPTDYMLRKSFFRLFIGNYSSVSSLKLDFKIGGNTFSSGGAQVSGYTIGVESRLVIFEVTLNIKTDLVWETFFNVVPGDNLIDNVVVANGRATITFNAAGRALFTGVTKGYVDLGCWIAPSLCIPIINTGYCLTANYDRTAKLEINY